MNQRLEYILPLKEIKAFLDDLFGGDNALVEVDLIGEGFIKFLGQELPERGEVNVIVLNLPGEVSIETFRPLLKHRQEISEDGEA